MMLFHYPGSDRELLFDATYITSRTEMLSQESADLWIFIQKTAQEASQSSE